MVIMVGSCISLPDDYKEKINNALVAIDGKSRKYYTKPFSYKRRLLGKIGYDFHSDYTAIEFIDKLMWGVFYFIHDLPRCEITIGKAGHIYHLENYSKQIDRIIDQTLAKFKG